MRDFNIPGECLVKVKGTGALLAAAGLISGSVVDGSAALLELGLTADNVQVSPRLYHADIPVDDYGPNVPAEVLAMLGEAFVSMRLIHYDPIVLDACIAESMGGSSLAGVGSPLSGTSGGLNSFTGFAGTLAPAGTPLMGYKNIFASGCHFMSLNVLSPVLNYPYRFPMSYIPGDPLGIPFGTERSVVDVRWRALPYDPVPSQGLTTFEFRSQNAVLWDHQPD